VKCDGTVDNCHTEILDEEGRKIAFLSDRRCDETFDSCTFYEYSENDDVVKEEIKGDCKDRLKELGLSEK
jgi:hypothetical protein